MMYWKKLSLEAGFDGLHLIGENIDLKDKDKYGLDAVTYARHREIENRGFKNRYLRWFSRNVLRIPGNLRVFKYKDAMKYFLKNNPTPQGEYPCIVPNWDTTARLQEQAVVLHKRTPKLFAKHVDEVLESIKNKPEKDKIVYLKSWNEWAEGNYFEPDHETGTVYLEVLKDILIRHDKDS